MLTRNSLDSNILHILGYFIENSKLVKHRKRKYYCLKPSWFGTPKKIKRVKISEEKTIELPAEIHPTEAAFVLHKYLARKLDPSKPETKWEVEEKLVVTRKIFGTYVNYLLKMKLVTQIEKSNDKRSKFYSITPWGICYLLKYGDYVSRGHTQRIFDILEVFATRNVKPYSSGIFGNKKIDYSNFYKRLGVSKTGYDHDFFSTYVSESILTKFEHGKFWQMITLQVDIVQKHAMQVGIVQFSNVDSDNEIGFEELEEFSYPDGALMQRAQQENLDGDQFHQYLSRFLLCNTVFSLVMRNDEYLSIIPKKDPKIKDLPEYKVLKNLSDDFLKCVEVFSRILWPTVQEVESRWGDFMKNIDNKWQKPSELAKK